MTVGLQYMDSCLRRNDKKVSWGKKKHNPLFLEGIMLYDKIKQLLMLAALYVLAAPLGLEPRIAEPESAVLPIIPRGSG